MPARVSESIILRTYPFQESDLIVSFLARDEGKLRGVARRARRLKSSFGSGLERLSLVRLSYFQKETRELVSVDSCELIRSGFELAAGYAGGVALDYLAEVTDQLLPPSEPNERHFRLLVAVTDFLGKELGAGREEAIWPAVLYFSFWAVKLAGLLPELQSGGEARRIADEMLRKPVGEVAGREWPKSLGAGLRRQLVRLVEEHIERKLVTVPLLEAL